MMPNAAIAAGVRRRRGRDFFVAFLRRRPLFALGYAIVAAVALIGLTAPWIAPHSPITADSSAFLQPPSWRHPFGTDQAGLDVLSRVMHAPRVDLTIALAGTLLSALLGASLGALVGFHEGRGGAKGLLSLVILRASDVLQSFPVFAFALALVAVFGQSIESIVFAIVFVSTPIYLRLMRAQALALRNRNFVEAAVMAGASDGAIILRHIVPNALGPILAQTSVNIGMAILLTAGLSFIGAGVRAPTPEWGSMIAMGYQNIITGQWWPSLFPGLALSITVFGFGLIGASIEVLSDPARRRALGDLRGAR
jgi:peptide/nickel transport system permease protein